MKWQPGRKPGAYKWHEIQDNVAYYHAFDVPKIVFPDISKRTRFALDRTGAYPDCTAFLFPADDLFLLGILNSTAVEDFFTEISAEIRGGFLRFKEQYVEQIPVPTATGRDRNAIEDLVGKCIAVRGQELEAAELEAEINARVARLYGLEDDSNSLPAVAAAGTSIR